MSADGVERVWVPDREAVGHLFAAAALRGPAVYPTVETLCGRKVNATTARRLEGEPMQIRCRVCERKQHEGAPA